jgi:hypothetical protein
MSDQHNAGVEERTYHCDIGFPAGFDIAKYLRNLPEVLVGCDHYEKRRKLKGIPQMVSADWVKRARLITITRRNRVLKRYTVRGPWRGNTDLTVAIDAATGRLITGWFNRRNDWHRLTKASYSAPTEV